jgi:hypothetical protein
MGVLGLWFANKLRIYIETGGFHFVYMLGCCKSCNTDCNIPDFHQGFYT